MSYYECGVLSVSPQAMHAVSAECRWVAALVCKYRRQWLSDSTISCLIPPKSADRKSQRVSTATENTITYHNALCLSLSNLQFLGNKMALKTMLMQNFGVTNKEHYGMFKRVHVHSLWYVMVFSVVVNTPSEVQEQPILQL